MNKEKNREKKITILINQKPYHFTEQALTPEQIIEKVEEPSDYEVWKIIKDPDPEGELPKDDLRITSEIEIKSGDRFRVVPPGTFGGGTIPDAVQEDIKKLQERYGEVEAHEGNPVLVVIKKFPLPAGFRIATTPLLIKFPLSYPSGKLNMFWVDPEAKPNTGNLPFTPNMENLLGKQWLRYSWHPKKWSPGKDDVIVFIEFIEHGLNKVVCDAA